MKLELTLTGQMAVDLAGYLWSKYSERSQVAQAQRRKYTQGQFAVDIGLEETTLNSMMNAEGPSMRIAWETLQTLTRYFGEDFTRTVEISPPSDPPAAHWRLDTGEG